MAPRFLAFFFFVTAVLLLSYSAKADDDPEEKLLVGINKYRASLNLTALTENKNAHCLADKIAEQFKNQKCSNTTGANTVPGTEDQFPNYPQLLEQCNLNVTDTRDGVIMPACVPNLEESLVLSNFTESQYSQNLNSSQYTGAGIASDEDWIVVVLTTSTPGGDFAPGSNIAGLIPKVGFHCYWLNLLLGSLLVLMS